MLGCLLFSLYINDLSAVSDTLKSVKFADDTVLVNSDSIFDKLICEFNGELSKVNRWLLRNRLSLSVEKTVALIFTNRRQQVDYDKFICIANDTINMTVRPDIWVLPSTRPCL